MEQISLKEGTDIFNKLLFSFMMFLVFLFNFNTDLIMGISGSTWANLCILCFILWWSLHMLKTGYVMWNPIYTCAGIFALLCFISYVYSYSPDDTIDKIQTIILVLLMSICIFQYMTEERNIDFFLKIYSLSGTFMAIYILFKSDLSMENRLGDAVGDANLVGITLALSATVALYLFITSRNPLHLLQFLCMGAVIFLTGSRTASLMIVLAAVALLYLYAYISHWKLTTMLLITLFLVVVLFILWQAIMTIPSLYNALGIRIVSFFQISQGEHSINNEQSTQTRMIFAQRAFDWFSNHPIWGNGIDSFSKYNASFADGRYCFSHCNYTELLSGLGILGFSAYYGMYFYAFVFICKSGNPHALKYKALICTLIIEILIGDIGLVVYYEKSTWILIAIIAGMIQEVCRRGKESQTDERNT